MNGGGEFIELPPPSSTGGNHSVQKQQNLWLWRYVTTSSVTNPKVLESMK